MKNTSETKTRSLCETISMYNRKKVKGKKLSHSLLPQILIKYNNTTTTKITNQNNMMKKHGKKEKDGHQQWPDYYVKKKSKNPTFQNFVKIKKKSKKELFLLSEEEVSSVS